MKTLVVYYTRTGTTKKSAQALAKELNADIEELKDTVNRDGPVGYFKSGKEAMQKKLTKLKPTKKSPSDYDLVIIGTPVWGFTMSSPVRTYIQQHKKDFYKIAFFCTMGGSGDNRTFQHMQELSGKKPVATASWRTKEILAKKFEVKEFIEKIN